MIPQVPPSDNSTDAAKRLNSLLDYVEQVVRLDETAAMRLSEHRLPTGQPFIIHQHELVSLPGVVHDLTDDDGPIWLRIERLRRGAPPAPPREITSWIELSPDPDRSPILRDFIIVTTSAERRLALITARQARKEDCTPSPKAAPEGQQLWDIRFRLADHPSLDANARNWIETSWLPWAIAERPVRKTMALYQRFFEVAQLAEMTGGDKPFELVWGIGLARWVFDAHEIDLPLIERLVEIDIDEIEGAAIKVRPRDLAPTVNLRAFDEIGISGVSLAYDASRRALAALEPDQELSPYLRDSFEPILRACQSRLDSEGLYLPDTTALPTDAPPPAPAEHLAVSDRWVIFGRKRSDSFLLADIAKLKKSIDAAVLSGDLPGPCTTLVMGPKDTNEPEWNPLDSNLGATSGSTPKSEPDAPLGDLFFPKPFNDEQIAIVRRLQTSDGVIVQGPPGTGKTHTISNIICHAMATGQRMLVVSHAEPALAVLRDHLPQSVRPLAISVTTTEREGFRQLESAVRELQSIVETIRPDTQLRAIQDSELVILSLHKQIANVDGQITDFAHRQLSPIFDGKRAAELAETVVANADRHAWFSDRPETTSAEIAPTDEEMRSLRAARANLGLRLPYLGAQFPSPDDLPDPDTMAKWHGDLQRAKTHDAAAKRNPSIRISFSNIEAVDAAAVAADALRRLSAILASLRSTPWLSALADRAINRSETHDLFDLLRSFTSDAKLVADERKLYIATPVKLPDDFAAAGPDALALVAKLAAGQKAFGLFSRRERALRPIIDAIEVQGRPPENPDEWTHVQNYTAWRDNLERLATRWQALADELDAPTFTTARELADLVMNLEVALKAPAILEQITRVVSSFLPGGISPQLLWSDPSQADAIEDAIRNAVAAAKLNAVRADINRLATYFADASTPLAAAARAFLTESIGDELLAPETAAALWSDIRSEIDDLAQHAPDFQVLSQLTDAIGSAGAPNWAQRLQTEPATDHADALMPNAWRDAWDWAVASAYLKTIDNHDQLRLLAEERVRLDASLRTRFEKLVRERTYYELGRKMTGPIKAALMMFATAVRRTGKGGGKSAGRFRRAARDAMAQCYSAIPCWIMPSWRVAEQLPGEVGTFDLVIIDEASQSDIRELPALLRGKKILVVGDDRQVSPTAAFIENAKIDRLEHNYLRDQPYKTLLLPGSSLYDLAKVMFPDKLVMLREHFRCVEPIIRFSMGFYPEPLVPLRIPTAHERLDPPLIDIFVPDGQRTGDKQNRREAEIIVAEIKRIAETPAIARLDGADRWRTIGVVSLIGAKQAALISRLILEELGEELVLRHRIACGDSAAFQGNERDIMFLSMIADSKSKQAQTATQFEQRFNVALSRARDRMVLVRSVHENELNPLDLKARVIRHFKDPMAGAQVRSGDLEAMCESNFEREVLHRLLEQGYRVTPQVGAEGYRIDLVVEGASGRRLAIECDGDKYHGPERWADDMHRQRILERVGWRFWRCWASSFTLNPDACMVELFSTLRQIGVEPDRSERPASYYTQHIIAKPHGASTSGADRPPVSPVLDAIAIGDRVVIQYLDDRKQLAVVLTRDNDDVVNGFLSVVSPLGAQLLGNSADDEIEFAIDGRSRRVLILKVEKAARPPRPASAVAPVTILLPLESGSFGPNKVFKLKSV